MKQTVPDKTDLTVDKSDLSRLGTFKSTSSRLPKSTPNTIYSNEFRELSRHYDVSVEPNHLKFNVFSQFYLLCLSSL